MSAGIYEKFYINFTTSISRNLLEDLAQGLVNSNATHRLAKLVDQYLDYCCLEENTFSLERRTKHVYLVFIA